MSECSCSPPLPSPDVDNRSVFCAGPLLDRVQRSNMFPDSKYFVDMSCIFSPAQTMADYEMFSNCAKNDGSLKFLQMFVERHFNPPGSELEPWVPTDWKAQPSFLNRISDPQMKQYAAEINELWKQLGRRINDAVQKNPEMYSIIYVPNPFIIPDTGCREYSYWGSFWIIRGLLQCGMIQTARGMIENFLSLVQEYGYVPACGRIYCLERTQPPLLIMMMKAYVEVTKDEQFAIQSLPLLETEFETFVAQHSVEVKGRTMYQYRSASSSPGPRPEAYADDLAAAEGIADEKAREEYYTELKSASESGQEFSSRWFVAKDCLTEATRSDTRPSAIVPVELNAIIFRSGKILAEFNRKAGNARKAEEYQDRSCVLVKAIRDILWNSQVGIWLDYDVEKRQSRNNFCCTNFAPLWARAFPLIDTDKVSKGVMEYIRTNKLDDLYGGVPHTLNKKAGEKWDYPNVFPPMIFMVVEGLDNLGTKASKAMSRRWAHRWVKSNYDAFKTQGFMYEKYFCEEFGSSEAYPSEAAVGYGWSNAVIIEFLCKHGREISMSENEDKACQCKPGKVKDSYVITSHASMETNAVRTNTSREVEKMKSSFCGELISKTTAAIGTQSSAFRPAAGSKSMDRKSCTCSTNKTSNCGQRLDDCTCAPVAQPKAAQQCCCSSGKEYKTGRCKHQELPTCSCSISRTQMVPVELDVEHFPDCPCYHDKRKGKQGKCAKCFSSKKKQKQQNYDANYRRQTDSDQSDCRGSASGEQQKWSKKQRQQDDSSDGRGNSGYSSDENQKYSKKSKRQEEDCACGESDEQQKSSKRSRNQEDEESNDPYGNRSRSTDEKSLSQGPYLTKADRQDNMQGNLVGHYAPLADDETPPGCAKPKSKRKRSRDCRDDGASDDDCGERKNPSNEVYFSQGANNASGSCGCSTGPSAQPSRSQNRGSADSQPKQYSLTRDYANDERSATPAQMKKGAPPDCFCPGGVGDKYPRVDYSAPAPPPPPPQIKRPAAECSCPGGIGAEYSESRGSVSQASYGTGAQGRGQQYQGEARASASEASVSYFNRPRKPPQTKKFNMCGAMPKPQTEECDQCRGGVTMLQKHPGRLQHSPCHGGAGPTGYSPTDQNIAADDCPCFARNIGADDIWCAPCSGGKHAPGNRPQGRQGNDQSTQSATALCPHCGGVYSGPKTASSTAMMGSNKTDDCECDPTQMKGMSSIGLQRGCCKPEPRGRSDCIKPKSNICNADRPGYYEKGDEYCSCHGESPHTAQQPPTPAPQRNYQMPVYGPDLVPCACGPGSGCKQGSGRSGRAGPFQSGRPGPASSPRSRSPGSASGSAPGRGGNCGPCATKEAKDHAEDNGPTPMHNRQFSLRDPTSNDELCMPKKKEKAVKCCDCEKKEEEEDK